MTSAVFWFILASVGWSFFILQWMYTRRMERQYQIKLNDIVGAMEIRTKRRMDRGV